jgi:cytochrome c
MERMNIHPRVRIVTWLMVASLLLAACGGGGRAGDGGSPASSGERIFATRCAACHATSAEARIGPGLAGLFAPGGPALPNGIDYGGRLPNGAAITDESVAAWIREGGQGQIGRMPGMALSEQEMAELLMYLKSLEP